MRLASFLNALSKDTYKSNLCVLLLKTLSFPFTRLFPVRPPTLKQAVIHPKNRVGGAKTVPRNRANKNKTAKTKENMQSLAKQI